MSSLKDTGLESSGFILFYSIFGLGATPGYVRAYSRLMLRDLRWSSEDHMGYQRYNLG